MDRALQSFSVSANLPFLGATPPYSGTEPWRAGTATPLGMDLPLHRRLEDKILRGEFIAPRFPCSTSGSPVTIAVGRLVPRFPLLSSVHGAEKKTSDRYIPQMADGLYDLHAGNCCRVSQAFHLTAKNTNRLLAGRKPSFRAWLGSCTMNSYLAGKQTTCRWAGTKWT